jgi:hypothetical protein
VTGQDALLHEANRLAHEVAKAGRDYWVWHTYTQNNCLTRDEAKVYVEARKKFACALDLYADADRRAQLEATA